MTVSEMEHVLVLSDDVEATREFYCRIVGLRVGARPSLEFHGYWLYAGETPCLHIADRRDYLTHAASLGLAISRQPPGTGSVDHIAFSADDYEEIRRRLADDGVRAVPNRVPAAGLRQLFFEDPNGVRVEINVRNQSARSVASGDPTPG